MILSPTSQISHHHKVTNITMSPTSLSPIRSLGQALPKKSLVGPTRTFCCLWYENDDLLDEISVREGRPQ